MFTIKLIRTGEAKSEEMRCLTVPRVGELVYLDDTVAYPVRQVAYKLQDDGTHAPLIMLGEPAERDDQARDATMAAEHHEWQVPLDGQAEGGDPYSELSDQTRNEYRRVGVDGF